MASDFGRCPVCGRHYVSVRNHLKRRHPQYVADVQAAFRRLYPGFLRWARAKYIARKRRQVLPMTADPGGVERSRKPQSTADTSPGSIGADKADNVGELFSGTSKPK